MEKAKVFCAHCQKEWIPEGSTLGYGIASETSAIRQAGDKLCFACCALDDKAQMDDSGKIWLYLTHEPFTSIQPWGKPVFSTAAGKVTNWPGTLSFPCRVKRGKHNIARTRYDVWFKDHNGNPWHGVQVGDNTQICRCRKLTRKGK
jgi:hypothetical protein